MARARRGAGSVYQRKGDGRWVAAVPATATEPRVVRYAATEREAAALLARLQAARAAGARTDRRYTVEALLEEWLDSVVAVTRPTTTLVAYQKRARLYLVPTLGRVPLEDLTPALIQRTYAHLTRRGLAARTVISAHLTLHTALEQAIRWGLLGQNPSDRTQRPRAKSGRPRVLTAAEVGRLLAAARGTRFEALWYLAAYTGMRPSELVALRWSSFTRDLGRLTVRERLARPAGRTEVGAPKTPQARRTIPLEPPAVEAVRRHRAREQAAALALGEVVAPDGYLFTTIRGAPYAPEYLWREWRRVADAAGLPRGRFYVVRHTVASQLLRDGVAATDAAALLGHADAHLLHTVYGHAYEDAIERATARLGRLYGAPIAAPGEAESGA